MQPPWLRKTLTSLSLCPFKKVNISDTADRLRHCGRSDTPSENLPQVKTQIQKALNYLLILLVVALLLLLLWLLLVVVVRLSSGGRLAVALAVSGVLTVVAVVVWVVAALVVPLIVALAVALLVKECS